MDRVSRLIVLLLLLACGSADAAYTKAGDPWWQSESRPDLGKFATSSAACSAFSTTYSGDQFAVTALPDGPDGHKEASCAIYSSQPNNKTVVREFCAPDSFLPGSGGCYKEVPSCPSGQAADAQGICKAPEKECAPKGHTEGGPQDAVQSNSVSSGSVCIDGCAWTGGGINNGGCLNGKCYTFGPFTSTGAKCSGDGGSGPNAEETPETEAKCAAKGQGSITINGTTTCVPNSKSESEKESSETKTDDTGTTKTDKKTNTKCEGSKCTTTTEETTTGPGGTSSTKTTTTEEPKQDYCQKNPTALECKDKDDESSWGGSCESQFTCDGDAVQCAQARAGWEAACALQTDQNNSMVLKAKTALGQDGLGDNDPREASSTFSLAGYINGRSYGPNGGACVDDYTMEYAGRSITIPFSKYCTVLAGMGVAGNAITMIIAIGIVFGGNRRGVD